MKTLKRAGLIGAVVTVGLALAPARVASTADSTRSAGSKQDSMPVTTDNTRTGTDNLGPTATDTGRRASTPPPAEAPGQTTAADNALVVAKLHLVNQMEIEAGLLAQRKAQAQGVKSYGRRLARDHQSADEELLSYARQRRIDVKAQAPAVERGDPEQARMQDALRRLAGLAGAEFDREFLKVMEEGQRKTIEFASTARAETTDPQLKTLIAELLPTLEKHHLGAVTLMDRTARTNGTTFP